MRGKGVGYGKALNYCFSSSQRFRLDLADDYELGSTSSG